MRHGMVTKSDFVTVKSIHPFMEGVLACLPYLTVTSSMQGAAAVDREHLQDHVVRPPHPLGSQQSPPLCVSFILH